MSFQHLLQEDVKMKKLLIFSGLLTCGSLFWFDVISITEVCVFFIFGVASLIITPFLLIIINALSRIITESFIGNIVGPKGRKVIEILFYVPGVKNNRK
jgi:hypothetical protein